MLWDSSRTVRLYPLDPAEGAWQGDRLDVLPEFRAAGLGAPLVRFAVSAAGQRGGVSMLTHVHVANERFFTRLCWTRQGDVELYVGRPHLLMTTALCLLTQDSRPPASNVVRSSGVSPKLPTVSSAPKLSCCSWLAVHSVARTGVSLPVAT